MQSVLKRKGLSDHPGKNEMPSFAMRVSESMFFIPPSAGLETQSSQREYMFSFLLRGQKRKDLTA